jgi:glycopeptide antibiotics resistance protein
MLYMPFGFAATRLPGRGKGRRTILLAAGLSLLTEWSQIFSHDRIPSTTDVCCNMLGAGLGGVLSRLTWRPALAGPESRQ